MESRRDFIKKTLRIGAFTAIASTTAYLLVNRDGESACDLDFTCSGCKKDSCKLRKEDFSNNNKDT